MDAQTFLDNFGTIAEGPGGVDRLRDLIRDLAVSGQLVSLQPDEDATSLLAQLASESVARPKARRSPQQKAADTSPDRVQPFQLPTGWRWTPFREVASIASNLVDPALHPGEPHVAPDNIEKRRGRLLPYRTVQEDGVTSSKHKFHAGQILYSKIRPNLSKAVVVDFDGLCSADMYPVDARIEPRYLHLFILSETFIRQVTRDDNRLAMPKVNQSQLSEVLVAVPPLTAQRRIVAKVDELMQLCDDLEARQQARHHVTTRLRSSSLDALTNAETDDDLHTAWSRIHTNWEALTDHPDSVDAVRQSILNLAVRGRLTHQEPADGDVDEQLSEFAAAVQNSTLIEPIGPATAPWRIPSTWRWVRFKQIADFTPGKTPPTKDSTYWDDPEHGHLWASISDMPDAGTLLTTDRAISAKAVAEVMRRPPAQVGALLMSFKLTIGKVCRVGQPTYFNEAIIEIDTPREVTKEFLFRTLPLLALGGSSKAAIKGNTLNKGSITNIPIPLPPLAEQERIVASLDHLTQLCDDLQAAQRGRESVHEALADSICAAAVQDPTASGG